MNKFINWLAYSSKDSEKVSLTLKSFLTFLVTVATIVAGFYKVQLPSEDLTAFVDTGIALVQSVLVVASFASTIVGLVRKIWRTYNGTNAVINDAQALNS